MNKPNICNETVKSVYESRFVKVFDLQYAKDCHYYDATRREKEDIVAIKNDEEFKNMIPDAVTIALIIKNDTCEPKLLLSREYRYPVGHFLLSPPAGLIDAEDKKENEPLVVATIREIKEETGIDIKDGDRVEVINSCLFSSPGMTDESNALVLAVVNNVDESIITQTGAVGSELFDGYVLLSKEEAMEILKAQRDEYDFFYSVYTWAVMMYFVSDIWK